MHMELVRVDYYVLRKVSGKAEFAPRGLHFRMGRLDAVTDPVLLESDPKRDSWVFRVWQFTIAIGGCTTTLEYPAEEQCRSWHQYLLGLL